MGNDERVMYYTKILTTTMIDDGVLPGANHRGLHRGHRRRRGYSWPVSLLYTRWEICCVRYSRESQRYLVYNRDQICDERRADLLPSVLEARGRNYQRVYFRLRTNINVPAMSLRALKHGRASPNLSRVCQAGYLTHRSVVAAAALVNQTE